MGQTNTQINYREKQWNYLNVFAMVGMFINDLIAGISVLGSTILLFRACSRRHHSNATVASQIGVLLGWCLACCSSFNSDHKDDASTPRVYYAHVLADGECAAGSVHFDADWSMDDTKDLTRRVAPVRY